MFKKIILIVYFIFLALTFFYPPWLAGHRESNYLHPVTVFINVFQRPVATEFYETPAIIHNKLPLYKIDTDLLTCRIGFETALFGAIYFLADFFKKRESISKATEQPNNQNN